MFEKYKRNRIFNDLSLCLGFNHKVFHEIGTNISQTLPVNQPICFEIPQNQKHYGKLGLEIYFITTILESAQCIFILY